MTFREVTRDQVMHRLFEAQAIATPNAMAVLTDSISLTYQELNERASQLAHELTELGVTLESPVGIHLPYSLELPIAILAVIKAGGACVFLDPNEYPLPYVQMVINDVNAAVVLELERSPCEALEGRVPVLRIPDATKTRPTCLMTRDAPQVSGTNAAYIEYTSGSTGRPKGVIIEHRRSYARNAWQQGIAPLTCHDRVLLNTNFRNAFWPWSVGATLVVPPPHCYADGTILHDILNRCSITLLHCVPATLQLLLEASGSHPCHSLRHAFCAGEPLSTALAQAFYRVANGTLHNLYASTEASIMTHFVCDPTCADTIQPIGNPIHHVKLLLLDPDGLPVQDGHAGEIHIGGWGLARGYVNLSAETSQKFVTLLTTDNQPIRVFRTGDLALRRIDGTLEFLGRADEQVKIRGCRIEPRETALALARHESVAKAVAVVRRDVIPGETLLVAYVEPRLPDRPPCVKDLRRFLTDRVPRHLLPSFIVTMEKIPLLPGGKPDKLNLPKPTIGSRTDPLQQDESIDRLIRVWESVLKVTNISPDDRFSDLGGHSLNASTLVFAINEEFHTNLELSDLVRADTVNLMARLIARDNEPAWSEESTSNPQATLQHSPTYLSTIRSTKGDRVLITIGQALIARLAADDRFTDASIASLRIDGSMTDSAQSPRHSSVATLCDVYSKELTETFQKNNYIIFGFSYAGLLAYELGRCLTRHHNISVTVVMAEPDCPTSLMQRFSTFYRNKTATMGTPQTLIYSVGRLFSKGITCLQGNRNSEAGDKLRRIANAYSFPPTDCSIVLIGTALYLRLYSPFWSRLTRGSFLMYEVPAPNHDSYLTDLDKWAPTVLQAIGSSP